MGKKEKALARTVAVREEFASAGDKQGVAMADSLIAAAEDLLVAEERNDLAATLTQLIAAGVAADEVNTVQRFTVTLTPGQEGLAVSVLPVPARKTTRSRWKSILLTKDGETRVFDGGPTTALIVMGFPTDVFPNGLASFNRALWVRRIAERAGYVVEFSTQPASTLGYPLIPALEFAEQVNKAMFAVLAERKPRER